jgi:hypothetical protein
MDRKNEKELLGLEKETPLQIATPGGGVFGLD